MERLACPVALLACCALAVLAAGCRAAPHPAPAPPAPPPLTADAPEPLLRFALASELRGDAATLTRLCADATAQGCAFVCVAGDIVQDAAEVGQWQAMMSAARASAVPVRFAAGNRDFSWLQLGGEHTDALHRYRAATGNRPNRTFAAGPARFIVPTFIQRGRVGLTESYWLDFLAGELAACAADPDVGCAFILMHQPPDWQGWGDGGALGQLLAAAGPAVWLAGQPGEGGRRFYIGSGPGWTSLTPGGADAYWRVSVYGDEVVAERRLAASGAWQGGVRFAAGPPRGGAAPEAAVAAESGQRSAQRVARLLLDDEPDVAAARLEALAALTMPESALLTLPLSLVPEEPVGPVVSDGRLARAEAAARKAVAHGFRVRLAVARFSTLEAAAGGWTPAEARALGRSVGRRFEPLSAEGVELVAVLLDVPYGHRNTWPGLALARAVRAGLARGLVEAEPAGLPVATDAAPAGPATR